MKPINNQSRQEIKSARAIAYAAQRFGLKPNEVVGYHSGCCYSKVWVKTRASAEKVAKQLKGDTVNGGWFDGMPLGGIQEYDGVFEVMC